MVNATLPYLTPTVRAMVELQRATGMRPGEVRYMTPAEIDRSGPVWVYRPRSHKTAYRGRVRFVWLGPRGQAILAPLLDVGPDSDNPLFSPVRRVRNGTATPAGYPENESPAVPTLPPPAGPEAAEAAAGAIL